MKMSDVPHQSLQNRLRGRLLIGLTLLWLVTSVLTISWLRHEMNEVLDSALEETAQRVLTFPVGSQLVSLPSHQETVQLQLVDMSAKVLWRTHEAPKLSITDDLVHSRLYTEGEWRVSVQHDAQRQITAVAAESLKERSEAMWASARTLLLPLLVLLPLAAWWITWTLRRAFAPVNQLRQELAHRSSSDLQPLSLPESLPDELSPLFETLNQLLGRVQQSLQAERHFAANSAHELRTPLAAAQANAQRLLAEVTDSVHHERINTLIRQIDRLNRLTSKLLQLSRIDSGLGLSLSSIELNQLCYWVLDEFEQTSPAIHFVPCEHSVYAQGDMDALAIALRNLLENAVHHAGAQAFIECRVTDDAEIVVVDDGPGAPPDTLERLKQPFARGESLLPGHGLGLALVDRIAEQSGGKLVLTSPVKDGRGFQASLQLTMIRPTD